MPRCMSHWPAGTAGTTSLALLLFCTASHVSLAQSNAPEEVFWDGFETGDLLHWQGLQLPGGGSIGFPPGSVAPGTQVEVLPVSMPGLPADLEALGQAYEITVTHSLLAPAILTLPLPEGDDGSDVWIVGIRGDGSITVHGAWIGTSTAPGRTVNGGQPSDTWVQAAILFELTGLSEATSLARIDPASKRPRIILADTYPTKQRIRERVTAKVDWEGEATLVDFLWHDGDQNLNPVGSSARHAEQDHYYEEKGLKRLVFKVVNETPSPDQIATSHSRNIIWVGIEGVWGSTSGTITFEAPGAGTIRGTYNDSQNGVIVGKISDEGHVLNGNWVETLSNVSCDSEMPDSEGTPRDTWGTLRFVFDKDFTSFCGEWSYCDHDLTGVWRGWAPGFSAPTCP